MLEGRWEVVLTRETYVSDVRAAVSSRRQMRTTSRISSLALRKSVKASLLILIVFDI